MRLESHEDHVRTGVGHQSHTVAHHTHLMQAGLAVEQNKTGNKYKDWY